MPESERRGDATETNETTERPSPAESYANGSDGATSSGRWLGAGRTFRLDPPALRTTADAGEERRATWFELFFDLVFAAAIGQLAAAVARHPSATVLARFAGLFVVVCWAWILYTLYANRFDTDDLIFRGAQSAAMLAIAVIAIDLHRVMGGRGGGVELAVAYVVLRAVLVALYFRARHHSHDMGRSLSNVYIVGYSATTGLWLVSVFLVSPYRYITWTLAILIDLGVPTRAWARLKGSAVVVSHLTDRFGTFFIIVLGEAVIAVVAGVAGLRFSPASSIVAATCFLIALSLWWIYFDLADTSVVGRGALGLTFVYAHFPLLAGVAAFGAGTKLAIMQASHHALDAATRWTLAGGIAAFALSLAAIHLGAEWTTMRDRTLIGRLGLAAVAAVLAAVGSGLAPVVFVALLAVALLAQLLLEALTPREGAATIIEPQHRIAEVARAAPSEDADYATSPAKLSADAQHLWGWLERR